MEVTILAGAEAELFEAWKRYEELMPGLGDRFDLVVRSALKIAAQFPESAPHYAGEFQRLLVRRFTHGIFYRVHGRRLVVTAVLDLRQNPDAILRRLGF